MDSGDGSIADGDGSGEVSGSVGEDELHSGQDQGLDSQNGVDLVCGATSLEDGLSDDDLGAVVGSDECGISGADGSVDGDLGRDVGDLLLGDGERGDDVVGSLLVVGSGDRRESREGYVGDILVVAGNAVAVDDLGGGHQLAVDDNGAGVLAGLVHGRESECGLSDDLRVGLQDSVDGQLDSVVQGDIVLSGDDGHSLGDDGELACSGEGDGLSALGLGESVGQAGVLDPSVLLDVSVLSELLGFDVCSDVGDVLEIGLLLGEEGSVHDDLGTVLDGGTGHDGQGLVLADGDLVSSEVQCGLGRNLSVCGDGLVGLEDDVLDTGLVHLDDGCVEGDVVVGLDGAAGDLLGGLVERP